MALNTYAKIGDGGVVALGPTTVTSITTSETVSNYTAVAQVLSFQPIMEREEHRVTNMASALKHQFIPGHLSATVQMQINFTPIASTSNVDSDTLWDLMQSGAERAWLIRIPSGTNSTSDPTLYDAAFFGFMTSFGPSVSVDAPNTADVTLRVSDSVLQEQNAD